MLYILKSMKEIIITYTFSYIILIILGLIFYNKFNLVNSIYPYILSSFYIIITIYIHKKNKIEEKHLSTYFPLIYLGLSYSILANMIIFKINPPTNISNLSLILIISSSIIGPIYEEIVFRYIFFNRLKERYSIYISILINSFIFALIHISPLKIIYAFFLGIIINVIYQKNKNIKAPILIHIASNTIALFLKEYNSIVLVLTLINLIISTYINIKKN